MASTGTVMKRSLEQCYSVFSNDKPTEMDRFLDQKLDVFIANNVNIESERELNVSKK